jgi:hypothetical protein
MARRQPLIVRLSALFAFAVVVSGLACDSSSAEGPGESGEGRPEGSGGETAAARAPPGEWVPTEVEEPEAIEIADDAFRGAGDLLPRPAELGDWVYVEEIAYYSSSNLAELIDGGGASYIQIGFVQNAYGVLSMRTPPEVVGRPVGLEIYIFQMAAAEGALLKFEGDHETGTCIQVEQLTSRHCLTSSSLDILHGAYYVRFILDAEDPALIPPLLSAAAIVQGRLP